MLKKTLLKILPAAALALASHVALAGSVKVLVANAEVNDNVASGHKYADFARTEIESAFMEMDDVSVVERHQLESLTKEMAMQRSSGMVDQEQTVEVGKMAGAKLAIIPTIEKVSTETTNALVFAKQTTKAKVRIRIVDIQEGSSVYSKTVEGEESGAVANIGGHAVGGASNDPGEAALENALKQFTSDEKLKKLIAKYSQ